MSNETNKDERTPSSFEKPCRCFSMSELMSSTDNFDEIWCIGQGGFGKVYKGKISDEPTNFYAIKRLHFESHQGASEFWAEVEMLTRLRHCNIVPLIGYCNEGKEMSLVYEYMPNGTLYDHLHKKGTILTWSQWLKICIGAARGLDYLHTGTGTQEGVIHRDVKSSNILLDQNYAAKIADFGLATIGPTNQTRTYVSTKVKGSFGYMDLNYFYTGRLTRKSDVYAFGVVLLEVLSGRPALDSSLEEGLAMWAHGLIKQGKVTQIISSNLRDHISKSSLKEFSGIAVRCLHSLPSQRPSMSEVVGSLDRALSFQEGFASSTQEGINMKKVWSFLSLKGHSETGSSGKNPKRFSLRDIDDDDDFDRGTGPRRFLLRDLNLATNNFSNANKLGRGVFGSVYGGYLSCEGIMVAVKKTSMTSPQGKTAYRNEVKVISSLRHRNLVKLIGWCHDDNQFLLVYEYLPNRSLDYHLFKESSRLSWEVRYKIAKGVASALRYLHEECEQCVVHRDPKTSNIMLDSEFNAKLGDFGLARLVDHERSPESTVVAGTLGYLAPEYLATGKFSKGSDVYSFGVVALEIACGRKAICYVDPDLEPVSLVKWVWGLHEKSELLSGVDQMLNSEFNEKEVECLMMVGLWCSHPDRSMRPSIGQAIQVLKFEVELPNLPTKMPEHNSFPLPDRGTGPQRFLLGDLTLATNNFSDANILGVGKFGSVYRGYLSHEDIMVAIKRSSAISRVGKTEYMNGVKVISSLRHQNLVKFIGWCHHETQLLLVYEFMPNGSLDSYLFDKKSILTWDVRYRIAKDVASTLLYLHEECEQCVVHRDVKTSNIMLDSGFNAKLGDFGLAKFMDLEQSQETTFLAGSLGYMAPEYLLGGKFSKESDVYSFGVVALEIACGKKSWIDVEPDSNFRIIEWVWGLHERSELLSGVDRTMNNEFNEKEVECLMMVGLWCSHPDHSMRPSISQAIQVLKFEGALPNLPKKMPGPKFPTSGAQV